MALEPESATCQHAWEYVDHREIWLDPDRIPWPPGARLATPSGRRPELVAFHTREWCSGCGALRTQHFSASNPDVPYHQVLSLPAQAGARSV